MCARPISYLPCQGSKNDIYFPTILAFSSNSW